MSALDDRAGLAGVYTFLYISLRQQDYALLMGAIALFNLLALVMFYRAKWIGMRMTKLSRMVLPWGTDYEDCGGMSFCSSMDARKQVAPIEAPRAILIRWAR